MPPKRSVKKQRYSSGRVGQEIIPFYEILSNPEIKDPLAHIIPQVQKCMSHNPILLKISFLNMLVRFCGLEEYTIEIDSQNTIQDLNNILQKVYQIKNTQLTPLILDIKNRFYIGFCNRITEFLQTIINDQLKVITDPKVQFNQSFFAWLQILTKSKLRNIRNAALVFAQILVEQLIKSYEKYHELRQSKHAFNTSKNIAFYLQKIFCLRFIDVDPAIRQRAFSITQMILEKLQNQLMTQSLLNKVFTPLFEEDPIIFPRAIGLIYRLLEKNEKIKALNIYVQDHINKFKEISKSHILMGANIQALRVLQIVHNRNPSLNVLNKGYFGSIFENFASKNAPYLLSTAVQIFYNSLYRTQEQIENNSALVFMEIINLILGIANDRDVSKILTAFFASTRKINPLKIFDVDHMMGLLLSQEYKDQRNGFTKLEQNQLSGLLTILTNWIQFCQQQYKSQKANQVYQKILTNYNTQILLNCKDLFFQKMTKYNILADKILNLYAKIHTPTLLHTNLENYLNFVTQKIGVLFAQDDLQNSDCYKQIASIYHNLSKDQTLSLKYSVKSLISKLEPIKLIQTNSLYSQRQIYKISAILSHYPIQQLQTSQIFMNKLIQTFAESKIEKQKIQILTITHMIHHHNFMELLRNISQSHVEIYKNCRNKFSNFYIQILSNEFQPVSIKLAGFRSLTFLLKQISNYRFQQSSSSKINAYQLGDDQMKTVFEYIGSSIYSTDSVDYSFLDITKMIKSISLQTQQVKKQITRLLFDLYEQSYSFTCHSQSVKFLASLIKNQDQLNKQGNKMPIASSSFDVTQQLRNRLNTLLQKYRIQQLKPSSINRLIYWRLAFVMFNQTRQDPKFNSILDKFIDVYYGKKKINPEQRNIMNNKLIIFILSAVDKIIERKQFLNFDIYENLLRKLHRRIEKQIIIRVKSFLLQKTQGIQSPYLKSFLQLWEQLSKVHVKKSKKQNPQKDVQNKQGQEESENDEDENQRMNDNKRGNRTEQNRNRRVRFQSTKLKNPAMEVEESDEEEQSQVQNKRTTRSGTKKKIR